MSGSHDERRRRTRRTGVGCVAAGLLLAGFGIGPAAAPAGADAGVTVTTSADGCTVSASGAGFTSVALSVREGIVRRYLAEGPTEATASYGEYLAATGQQVTFVAEGIVGDVAVVTEEATITPSCSTGATLHLDSIVTGTPPAGFDVVPVHIRDCSTEVGGSLVELPASGSTDVPVPPGVEHCIRHGAQPAGSGLLRVVPNRAVADADVEVHTDFSGPRVRIVEQVRRSDGTLSNGTDIPGLDPTALEFTVSSHASDGTTLLAIACAMNEVPSVGCSHAEGSLGIPAGGSIGVDLHDMTAPGRHLERGTFDLDDCVIDGVVCKLTVVLAADPAPTVVGESPPDPAPAPAPTPEVTSPSTTAAPAPAPLAAAATQGPPRATTTLARTGRTSAPLAMTGLLLVVGGSVLTRRRAALVTDGGDRPPAA